MTIKRQMDKNYRHMSLLAAVHSLKRPTNKTLGRLSQLVCSSAIRSKCKIKELLFKAPLKGKGRLKYFPYILDSPLIGPSFVQKNEKKIF